MCLFGYSNWFHTNECSFLKASICEIREALNAATVLNMKYKNNSHALDRQGP